MNGRPRFFQGLLIHAFIWWGWHLLVLIAVGWKEGLKGSAGVFGAMLILAVIMISSVLHEVLFAWIWARSGSIVVATVYHAAFDEVRDVLEKTTGFRETSPMCGKWQPSS